MLPAKPGALEADPRAPNPPAFEASPPVLAPKALELDPKLFELPARPPKLGAPVNPLELEPKDDPRLDPEVNPG